MVGTLLKDLYKISHLSLTTLDIKLKYFVKLKGKSESKDLREVEGEDAAFLEQASSPYSGRPSSRVFTYTNEDRVSKHWVKIKDVSHHIGK